MPEHFLPDATYHKLVGELALTLDPVTRLPDRARVVDALATAGVFPASTREAPPAMRGVRACWGVRVG